VARTLTKEEISALPVADRIELIGDLWDSLDPQSLPVPESHRRALDEALLDCAENPDAGESWDRIRNELFPKKLAYEKEDEE
jgi:putative addiction module component (TIGR02574 family)